MIQSRDSGRKQPRHLANYNSVWGGWGVLNALTSEMNETHWWGSCSPGRDKWILSWIVVDCVSDNLGIVPGSVMSGSRVVGWTDWTFKMTGRVACADKWRRDPETYQSWETWPSTDGGLDAGLVYAGVQEARVEGKNNNQQQWILTLLK